jgi:hypothetical protein
MRLYLGLRSYLQITLAVGVVLAGAFSPFAVSQAEAQTSYTYYVGPNGSDSAIGSETSPFATIQHAETVVGPGDTVIVLDGTYKGDITITSSGTSGHPITYMAQHKWQAKLVGTGTGDGSVVVGLTGGYIRIDNFDVTGSDANGIILATGNTVGSTASYNQAIGNRVHDLTNMPCSSNSGSGISTGGGSNYLDVSHDDIIGNLIANMQAGSGCSSGPYPTGIYIQTPYDVAANNIVINAGYGLETWHNANHDTIYGNTVINSPHGGFIIGAGDAPSGAAPAVGTLVENNISVGNLHGFIEEGPTYNNSYIDNLVWNNGSCTPSSCTTNPTVVSGTVSADPKFVNNTGTASGSYTLQAGSPAIGAGLALAGVLTDFAGSPRPQSGSTDIGAYVYVTSAAPASPTSLSGVVK